MRTRLESGVLCNRQQLGSAVSTFTDQGKFEAMKTLSGRRAPCCSKHQFRAKITVRTSTFFDLSLLEQKL